MNTNPFEPMRIDQRFNDQSSYGPHEGIDCSVVGTYGNQDCGFDLKAIKDGEVTHVSRSTKNYGYLLCFKVVDSGRDYYVRYAHCSEVLVQPGDIVREGQVIAKMGSTGNSTACHLHLDVLAKKPDDWRFYTKMVTEWFIDPIWFIENIDGRITNEDTDPEKKYVVGLGDKTFDELVVEYSLERQRKIDKEKELGFLQAASNELRIFLKECQNEKKQINSDISIFFDLLSNELNIEVKTLTETFTKISFMDSEIKRLEKEINKPLIQKIIDYLLKK